MPRSHSNPEKQVKIRPRPRGRTPVSPVLIFLPPSRQQWPNGCWQTLVEEPGRGRVPVHLKGLWTRPRKAPWSEVRRPELFGAPMNTGPWPLRLKCPHHWDRKPLWHQRKKPRLKSHLLPSAGHLASLSLSFFICENELGPSQPPGHAGIILGAHSHRWAL